MKSYVITSSLLHGIFLSLAVILGTFLSKPRLSYYAVDLHSGPPPSAAQAVAESEPEKAPPPEAPPKPEPKSQIKEAIKIKEKDKKLPPPPKPTAKPVAAKPVAIGNALRSLSGFTNSANTNSSAGNLGGANVTADASGPAFPFPWYLKAISDKLDSVWKPPQEYENDTVCQITFTISRDGGVSGANIRKSSGNSYFDQLAVRAVQAASPMPPLPTGYPEDELRVHMKFIGKQ